MEKAKISLYLDDKCNINCNYCSVNYDIKKSISEKDIEKFIKENEENIDFEYISLLGGEPSIIYSEDFFNFLAKKFKFIQITSNIKEIDIFLKMIKKYNNKISISASFNKEIKEIFKQNINTLYNNIERITYVVTKDDIETLYENIKFLSQFNKLILIEPEVDKNNIGYKIDGKKLEEQLNLIWEDKLENNLINLKRIKENEKTNQKKCQECNISITKTGSIESCSHACSYYKTAKCFSFGNIFETKIKDIIIEYPEEKISSYDGVSCEECKICHNFSCVPRIYETKDKKIQEQICEFNRIFYNFATNYIYKINVKSLSIFMTEQCNMKCTYCFERNFKNKIGKVSNDIIKKAIDLLFVFDTGIEKKLTFFGGEPTLNIEGMEFAIDYYIKLKEKGYKNTIYFDINTNLLYINDKLIDLFKKIKKHAGLYISVSLDGFKDINDTQRIDIHGNPTYEKIIENVKKLNKELVICKDRKKCERVKICKHTVMTNENLPFIEKIAEEAWALKDLFTDFSTGYVTPEKGEHNYLTYENLEFVKKYYDSLEKIEDKEKKEFIQKYLETLSLTEYGLLSDGYAICNVIEDVFSIRANGDIIPCHSFFDQIEDEKYETEIKINNIMDINLNNFGLNMKSKWFPLIGNKDEKLKNGELKIKSELGYDCALCPFKFMCHTCIANLKDIINGTLIKKEETCMRVLNQAEILLKLKEIRALKELKELQNLEEEKINNLIEGIIKTGNLTVKNKENIDLLLKEIEEHYGKI